MSTTKSELSDRLGKTSATKYLENTFMFNNYHRGCGCDMIGYDFENYGGRSLLVIQQNAAFANDEFNERIESVQVIGSCDWLLYQHSNFDGATYHLIPGDYKSASTWGGSDHISSARALPPAGTEAIVLFHKSGFRGRMVVLYGSNGDLSSINFNERLSSFIITGGRWTLYRKKNYESNKGTYGTGLYSTLPRDVGNDEISSVRKV